MSTRMTTAVAAVCAAAMAICSALALAAEPTQNGNNSAETNASSALPPLVGKCKTDEALRVKCRAEWDKCESVRHVGPVCQREWRKCCMPPPIPARTGIKPCCGPVGPGG